MSKNLLIAFAVGLVCVAIAVFFVFHVQRGAHIEASGKILKVRTAPIDDDVSLAVVDFRISNSADYRFMVQKVSLIAIDAAGKRTEGSVIPEIDAQRIFDAMPILGPKYNPSLGLSASVPPRTTLDRMTSARFEISDAKLQARKDLILRIDEVDGRAVAEFHEK